MVLFVVVSVPVVLSVVVLPVVLFVVVSVPVVLSVLPSVVVSVDASSVDELELLADEFDAELTVVSSTESSLVISDSVERLEGFSEELTDDLTLLDDTVLLDTTDDDFAAPFEVCVETLTIAFPALSAKIIETNATGVINGGVRYAI